MRLLAGFSIRRRCVAESVFEVKSLSCVLSVPAIMAESLFVGFDEIAIKLSYEIENSRRNMVVHSTLCEVWDRLNWITHPGSIPRQLHTTLYLEKPLIA